MTFLRHCLNKILIIEKQTEEQNSKKMFYIDLGFMFLLGLVLSIVFYYDEKVLLSDFGATIIISFFGYLVFFIKNLNDYKIKLLHICFYPISYLIGGGLGYALSKAPLFLYCNIDSCSDFYQLTTHYTVFGIAGGILLGLVLVNYKQKRI